jgi:uncharacterized protein (DUF849 family)
VNITPTELIEIIDAATAKGAAVVPIHHRGGQPTPHSSEPVEATRLLAEVGTASNGEVHAAVTDALRAVEATLAAERESLGAELSPLWVAHTLTVVREAIATIERHAQ